MSGYAKGGNVHSMNTDFIRSFNEIEREKGITRICCLTQSRHALISSYKRNFNTAQNVRVDIDRKRG